jgi:hypothetical protein
LGSDLVFQHPGLIFGVRLDFRYPANVEIQDPTPGNQSIAQGGAPSLALWPARLRAITPAQLGSDLVFQHRRIAQMLKYKI